MVAILSGCAPAVEMDTPAAQAGYADGCATAQNGRAAVDNAALRQEPGYRAGFASGRALCSRSDSSGAR